MSNNKKNKHLRVPCIVYSTQFTKAMALNSFFFFLLILINLEYPEIVF